jgi:mannitol-1-phosphate 5-dehydrogenase
MKSCVIFGAGAIGLAFLGDLLEQSGYRVTFADVRQDIVSWLNSRGEYVITLTDSEGERLRRIRGVRAINSSSYGKDEAVTADLRKALAESDIVFTACGESALASVGRVIGDALKYRLARTDVPLNIVCCENIRDPGGILRKAIVEAAGKDASRLGALLGISRSVISRMTPVVADPDKIVTEPYAEIPVEGKTWLGRRADIVGVLLVDDFDAYKMRKLIMHNMTHAVAAYSGYLLGKKDIAECVRDSHVGGACRGALDEARRIMAAEFRLPDDELREHAEDLLRRYDNPALGHTVPNVARDPIRKLAIGDRFHSAIALAEKHSINSPCTELGAACALNYDKPDDVSAPKLQQMIREKGLEAVLRGQCGLNPESGAGARIRCLCAAVRDARSDLTGSSLRRIIESALRKNR